MIVFLDQYGELQIKLQEPAQKVVLDFTKRFANLTQERTTTY